SRWPVPRTVRRPSASGRAIIALTFDEPMSSAATNCCSTGAATLTLLSLLLLLLRLAGDRLARSTRQAHDHLAGNAQVEADDPVPKKTGRLVEAGEFDQRQASRFFALR